MQTVTTIQHISGEIRGEYLLQVTKNFDVLPSNQADGNYLVVNLRIDKCYGLVFWVID